MTWNFSWLDWDLFAGSASISSITGKECQSVSTSSGQSTATSVNRNYASTCWVCPTCRLFHALLQKGCGWLKARQIPGIPVVAEVLLQYWLLEKPISLIMFGLSWSNLLCSLLWKSPLGVISLKQQWSEKCESWETALGVPLLPGAASKKLNIKKCGFSMLSGPALENLVLCNCQNNFFSNSTWLR